ncbi:MAG: Zn-ribbon domain-containing OB-fold protein [Burkholderiales bacterium]|nr:Zn-ribbon domain-containing OB-fold protein [Burkholderiales bacterium]
MSDVPFNNAGFTKLLSEHKLMGCRNKTSGKLYFPPRPLCTKSYTDDMQWEAVSGEGEVIAFTVITVPPTHMIEAGYSRDNPYCAGIVRLKEGPAISGQILGVNLSKPADSVKIGMPVKAVFIDRGEGEAKKTLLGFEVVK